ncbi:unnamed protein product [Trichobilharzia regenti]|nr:unnamed protein product [Trichobilharzia regenti]
MPCSYHYETLVFPVSLLSNIFISTQSASEMVNFEVLGSFWLIIAVFATTTNALDCNSFKQEWMKLRYTMLTGVHSPTSNICPVTGTSCCDINMEREMYTVGQRQLIKQCNSWLQVARKMSNDSASLELTFQMDLQQAKGRLHQFFSRIYGYNYKLHRNFFFGFFTDLEQYMAGQRGQLGLLIKNFFSQLRDSIVSLIERSGQVTSNPSFGNSGSVSSSAGSLANNVPGVGGTDEASESRRIRCLSDKVAQLRPFDDVDVRLHARMLEAYPPARMLVNVLSVTSKLLYQLVDQVCDTFFIFTLGFVHVLQNIFFSYSVEIVIKETKQMLCNHGNSWI